jgi:3-oxoacyl-(acyl-carrier-protein) synthase
MSRIYVCGCGAVSPAGWDIQSLTRALAADTPLEVQSLERPGWEKKLRVRAVPAPAARPAFLAHPRLRRSSPITHYAACALLESLAPLPPDPGRRVGLVVCLQSGCVQYTHRFFSEALADPATASPLLFPETVFAAPASHLAALLENTPLVTTLLGDPATFAQGLDLAADWLRQERVDLAVVVGAEEINWLRADALWHLEHAAIMSGGAGAVALCRRPEFSTGVELADITKPQTYCAAKSRLRAARAMRDELQPRESELLCDGLSGGGRANAAEIAAWRDWSGARLSPKTILGEGLMAAAAWQCAAACSLVAEGRFPAALVSLVGCNQQSIGVRFRHCDGAEIQTN